MARQTAPAQGARIAARRLAWRPGGAMRFAWQSLLLAGLLLAGAAARAQIDEAAAERLMRSSGLWEQLGATAAGARAGIEAAHRNRLTPLSAEEVQRLLRATDAAFAAETLRPAVRKALAARIAPSHLGAIETWLGSEPGRRITSIEVAASRPDRDSDRVIRLGIARLAEASEGRKRLIDDLVDATRVAEAITNMTINVAVAVQRGMASVRLDPAAPAPPVPPVPPVAPVAPVPPVPPVAALREGFAGQRTQMLQTYRGMSRALFADMYHALPDAELAVYLDFLRSAAGWQFLDATLQAMEQALVGAAEGLGTRLPSLPSVRPGPTT